MAKRTYWFDYKEEQISGWQYLLRMIIAGVLTQLVVPGLILASSTVYKRAKTLKWSYELSLLSAVLISINVLIGVFSDFFNTQIFSGISTTGIYVFILISVSITGTHFTLLFSNKPRTEIKPVTEETVSYNDSTTIIEKYNYITESERYNRLKEMILKSYSSRNKKHPSTSSKKINQITHNQTLNTQPLEGFNDLISSNTELRHDEENKSIIENEFKMRVIRSNNRYDSILDNNWSI